MGLSGKTAAILESDRRLCEFFYDMSVVEGTRHVATRTHCRGSRRTDNHDPERCIISGLNRLSAETSPPVTNYRLPSWFRASDLLEAADERNISVSRRKYLWRGYDRSMLALMALRGCFSSCIRFHSSAPVPNMGRLNVVCVVSDASSIWNSSTMPFSILYPTWIKTWSFIIYSALQEDYIYMNPCQWIKSGWFLELKLARIDERFRYLLTTGGGVRVVVITKYSC